MPIQGATLNQAVDRFRTHLNGVLAQTVTPLRLTFFTVGSLVGIGFRDPAGRPTEAPLETQYGPMRLGLTQSCSSTVKGSRRHRTHTLHTSSYRYTLTARNQHEAFVRWEYVKNPTGNARWCRHHLQGPIQLNTAEDASVVLDDIHLPTGFVTIEEVLRFCIVDMDVRPLSRNWHDVLTQSYERFKADFAPRGNL